MYEPLADLQNPHTVAYYAAMYEAEAASADFHEAYVAFMADTARAGSPLDHALWHAGGYLNAADAAVRRMPVWEAGS